MRNIFYLYLIIVLVLSACSSGRSTFEHGNYYDAVITSVSRLRRNSDHKKSIETLRQAYPLSVTFYEDRANASLASNAAFKWSAVVDSYTAINTMYDEIKRCPGALLVVPNPVNYFAKLQDARQNAAEEHYAAGLAALQLGNRPKAKEAYSYFKNANGFVPGYKDVVKKMEEALWAATVKVLVDPIPVTKNVGVSAEFFDNKVSEYVHSVSINEFVRFYTRPEAQKIKLNPDHIIKLEFDEFTVGQVTMHEKQTQLQKDSIVVGVHVAGVTNTPPNPTGGGTNLVGGSGTGNLNNEDKEKADKEKADKEKADKERADKEKADKEKADKERADIEKVDKEKADKERADKEKADKEKADKERADKEKADKEKADKERADKEKVDKEKADKERADIEKADKEKADKERADKEKADKEKADKERADKEKADKEKADKERADKEKVDKEKLADPTIKKEDTTDVKDPVTICHVPPGNDSKHKTLVISRSALKAHLDHGDIEGSCDQKDQGKGKDDDSKIKTPDDREKGTEKNDKKKDGQTLLYDSEPVFIASRDNDIHKFISYVINSITPAETDTTKIYATVKATLTHYKKTTTSKGIVSFKIMDAKTGALLSVEKMPGEFIWVSEWATFNGDERALSPEQLKLSKQKEQVPPSKQDLFIEFTKPIFDQVTSKIKAFYKDY